MYLAMFVLVGRRSKFFPIYERLQTTVGSLTDFLGLRLFYIEAEFDLKS